MTEDNKPDTKTDKPLIEPETKIEEPMIEETKEQQQPVVQEHPPSNFFATFPKNKSTKKLHIILFLVFALLTVGLLYLAKPTIESYIKGPPNLDEYIPVSSEPTSMHLEINNPPDELLTFERTINISGKTSPNSSVVISNGDLNWGVNAGNEGDFSKVIDLKPGINTLAIYAFDPQGNSKTDTRQIYMSEEKI